MILSGASHLDANIDDIVAQFGGTYVRGDIRGSTIKVFFFCKI